jgi:5-methylcytosine-specific restriction endonuclease McrA
VGQRTASARCHLVYLSRGGEDSLANVTLLCPTHHPVVHRADAPFKHGRLAFLFPNGRAEPLCLNRHPRQG